MRFHHLLVLAGGVLGTAFGKDVLVKTGLRERLRAALGVRQPRVFSDLVKDGEIVNGRYVPDDQANILAIQPRAVAPEQERDDFEEFDEDGNGHISLKELGDNLRDLRLDQRELKKIYSKLDLDNNGDITWTEFNTPLDIELFDFLDRTHDMATAREIEFVENLYTNEFGNQFAAMRNEPASEYNERGEEYTKPDADEKYLAGYGWFKGESPVVDAMYPNIQSNPDAESEEDDNPGKTYQYSYGFLQKSAHRK